MGWGKGKQRDGGVRKDYDKPYHGKKGKSSWGAGKSPWDVARRTVFCGNLSWSVEWQDLKDFMQNIGRVEHVEVLEYQDGRKTGSGLVTFVDAADAETAIKEYNETELDGRKIFIREVGMPRQPSKSRRNWPAARSLSGR